LIRFLISAGWLGIHQETALLPGLQIYSVIADVFSLSALSALLPSRPPAAAAHLNELFTDQQRAKEPAKWEVC
jgi:hypothetical protein